MIRKSMMIGIVFAAAAAIGAVSEQAPPDRITVPLSDPSKPALIEVQVLSGGIKVTGYEGKEVIVEAKPREKAVAGMGEGVGWGPMAPVRPMLPAPAVAPVPAVPSAKAAAPALATFEPDDSSEAAAVAARIAHRVQKHVYALAGTGWNEDEHARKEKAAGLKQIPLTSSGLTVEEDNNHITVETESFRRAYDIDIKVPYGSSLKLESTNMGEIRVENVTGEIEVENTNGPITLQNVGGTVVASTTNGDIQASLGRVATDKPLSFATFNGDIDLTLPVEARASLRLKSQEGDVFSDFDLALKTAPVKTEESGKASGKFRVSIERAAIGAINGGGTEIKLETYNGNIYIRKKK